MKKLYLLLLFLTVQTIVSAQTIRYVTPTGSGTKDGTSWANASDDLQAMINQNNIPSGNPGQLNIYIAKGTYLPYSKGKSFKSGTGTSFNLDKFKSFVIEKNVNLFGGFAGTETSINERNQNLISTTNETIFDGENNVFHVVAINNLGTTNVELNGITIKKGATLNETYAGQDHVKDGAGIYIANSTNGTTNVILNKVYFTENAVKNNGGALFIQGGDASKLLKITANNCSFENNGSSNSSISTKGTAIYQSTFSELVLENCEFKVTNNATNNTSAIYCFNNGQTTATSMPKLKITNCLFDKNKSNKSAGAIEVDLNVNLEIESSTFTNNETTYTATTGKAGGGAINYNANYSNLSNNSISNNGFIKINNSTFTENKSSSRGGAIALGIVNLSNNGSYITNCKFIKNTANTNGGAIDFSATYAPFTTTLNGTFYLENSVFYANEAKNMGGALNVILDNTFSNVNNTFYANKTTNTNPSTSSTATQTGGNGFGGAINFTYTSSNNIIKAYTYNCIFAGNTGAANFSNIHHYGSGAIDNTIFVTGAGFYTTQGTKVRKPDYFTTNSLDINNVFESIDETTNDFLYLKNVYSDLVIDYGDETKLKISRLTDLARNQRIFGQVDIGAYENQSYNLPVDFLSFDIKLQNHQTLLNWKVASETNNNRFTIERSTNGIDYTLIGAKKSLGNTSSTVNYSFIDDSPSQGINYYKLSQIDNDGTQKTLAIKAFNFVQNTANLQLYPTPATDFLTVKTNLKNTKPTTIAIYSISGKNVFTQTFSAQEITNGTILNLSHLSNGVYIISLENDFNIEKRTISISR